MGTKSTMAPHITDINKPGIKIIKQNNIIIAKELLTKLSKKAHKAHMIDEYNKIFFLPKGSIKAPCIKKPNKNAEPNIILSI